MASSVGHEPTEPVSYSSTMMRDRPRIIPHENSLGPVGHNRRASQEDILSSGLDSAISPRTVLPGAFEIPPTKLDEGKGEHAHDIEREEEGNAIDRHNMTLIAVDEIELPHANGKLPEHCHKTHLHLGAVKVKTIFAGPPGNQKRLEIPRYLLEEKSRYFRALFEQDPNIDQMIFADADPIAMGMLHRWIMVGILDQPDDFHSLTHWYALYVLSIRFEVEPLKNLAMDNVRHYYRDNKNTASPFRIEYIYKFTGEGDYMRNFVTFTAATRCIKGGDLTPGVRQILEKGGRFAADFAQAVLAFMRDPKIDVRLSPDCAWHTHKHSDACTASRRTQLDGASDAA